ncbi:ATP-binding protein [Companilactobacillus sp. HBUAS59699]|uniref:ATP-binding protein n=1 Tax=Companilactobacillus sp. HBUAS59699 TaxID=3109358 RepID=UPI002FEEEA45
MKLTRVKIYGFGKWSDVEWNLKEDYQIIYGHNEAGKTTLLTFIKSILFGFASARGDEKFQQYKPKNGGNYGGELQFVDQDKVLWTLRRVDGKNGGDVTLFRNDKEVPASLITRITGGFSKEDFESSHVLNDKNIISIYGLNEEQLETEIMAVGAVGSKEWLVSADKLEQASESLYKARGRKQPLAESIEKHDRLLKRKSEFDNQQVAYSNINLELKKAQDQYQNNIQQERTLSKQRDELSNLNDKWPRFVSYRDLSQVDVSLNNIIAREDWERSLKIDQELKTLRQNTVSFDSSILTDEEQGILNYYQSHKDGLDYLNSKKDVIRDLQFQKKTVNQRLNDNDIKIDSLHASNRDFSDAMQPLTDEELRQLTQPKPETVTTQNLNWPVIGVSIVALVLATLMSGPLRIGAGLVFVAGILYAWHQQQDSARNSSSTPQTMTSFIDDKGYRGLSIDRIQALQTVIHKLDELRSEQNGLESKLQSVNENLSQWQAKINDLQLLNDPDDLASNIERYFSKINALLTKQSLIEKNNLDNKKSQQASYTKIAQLEETLNETLSKYAVDSMDEFMKLHSEQLQKEGIVNKIEQDKSILGDDIHALEQFTDSDELRSRLEQVSRQLSSLYKQNDELNRQMGSIKTKRQQIFDNDEYQRVTDELAQNELDMVELYDQWLADKLASKWIHSMLDLATENRYPKMLKRAEHYFELLTDGHYIGILFDKNNLQLTRKDKMKFDVHELSKATTVQLYISLRLAFVIEISDLIDLPILIDDAFVDFDKIRTSSIFELIKEVAEENQIIYVTANLNSDLPKEHVINLEEVNNGSKDY